MIGPVRGRPAFRNPGTEAPAPLRCITANAPACGTRLLASRGGGGWNEQTRQGEIPKTKARPKTKLGLPDLDHSKSAVLDSLRSHESKRGYRHAIDEAFNGIAPNRDCRSTRALGLTIFDNLTTGEQAPQFRPGSPK